MDLNEEKHRILEIVLFGVILAVLLDFFWSCCIHCFDVVVNWCSFWHIRCCDLFNVSKLMCYSFLMLRYSFWSLDIALLLWCYVKRMAVAFVLLMSRQSLWCCVNHTAVALLILMHQFYFTLVLLIMRESFCCFLSHVDVVLVVLMCQSFLCGISFYDILVVLMRFVVASVALMC